MQLIIVFNPDCYRGSYLPDRVVQSGVNLPDGSLVRIPYIRDCRPE